MTINSVDTLIAGFKPVRMFQKAASGVLVIGRPTSYWATPGIPGPGVYDTTLNGVVLDSSVNPVAGQIPFDNPTGILEARLSRFVGAASQVGTLLLCDRLWHNGGITITSTALQAISSPTWPSRDELGGTTGVGVNVAIGVSALTGAGTPNVTLGYTATDGIAGKTSNTIIAPTAASPPGTFYSFALNGGEKGVRSIQSIQLSASWTSGTINLVAYRVLAMISIPNAGAPATMDAITGGLPRMYKGSVPFLVFIPTIVTTNLLWGSVGLSHG
jgi:hypothetical protein